MGFYSTKEIIEKANSIGGFRLITTNDREDYTAKSVVIDFGDDVLYVRGFSTNILFSDDNLDLGMVELRNMYSDCEGGTHQSKSKNLLKFLVEFQPWLAGRFQIVPALDSYF